jgi:hypothetical protein
MAVNCRSRATSQWLALTGADIALDKSHQLYEQTVLPWQVSLPFGLLLSRTGQLRLEASFNSSLQAAAAMLDESCVTR